MKLPQFSLATLLLLTSVIGISSGAWIALVRILRQYQSLEDLSASWAVSALIVLSPIWLPIVFLAFAAGRRRLTVMTVACLTIAEAISLGAAILVINYWR
jgi:hypothetical protein